MNSRPVYIVLHVYKTAGLTLRGNFRINFRRQQWLPMYVQPIGLDVDKSTGSTANPGWIAETVRDYVHIRGTTETECLFGHMAYFGVHELLPGLLDPRYIVFLRHPVDRLVSLYSYLKHDSHNCWHREIVDNGWTLEEWLTKSPALWIHNGQLRQLLIGTHPEVETERPLTAAHLAEARRRLQQFWFVGITERFRDDARYLYGKLGFTRFHGKAVVNATTRKEPVSRAIQQQIIACNQLDMELYQFGRSLRAAMIRRRRPAYMWHQLRADVRRAVFDLKDAGRDNRRSVGYRAVQQ